jgi:hypothetical protein
VAPGGWNFRNWRNQFHKFHVFVAPPPVLFSVLQCVVVCYSVFFDAGGTQYRTLLAASYGRPIVFKMSKNKVQSFSALFFLAGTSVPFLGGSGVRARLRNWVIVDAFGVSVNLILTQRRNNAKPHD